MTESPSAKITAVKDECTKEHCFAAFDALYCALTNAPAIEPSFVDDKYPLFVTWNTRSRRGYHRLRGCIGNFSAMRIRSGIPEYALISAFEDHRFSPIRQDELEKLECEVSLLTNFENAEDYLDWTIGTHGIQITFQHPFYSAIPGSDSGTPVDSNASLSTSLLSSVWSSRPHEVTRRKYSATYLPDVMPAQQWTKLQAIDSAIRKAGWDGKITDELRRGIQVRRYQSSKACATWEEYVQWREGYPSSVRV